jgi:hypothetical protein
VWQWEIAIERESADDETTCLGVALWPISWANYESSHEMWLVSTATVYISSLIASTVVRSRGDSYTVHVTAAQHGCEM